MRLSILLLLQSGAAVAAVPATTAQGGVVGQPSPDILVSVSGRGDIDGDGFPELVMGDPLTQTVYVDWSPATPVVGWTSVATVTGTGDFGADVTVGDVNGDGFADLIVGAPGANGGDGAVYIYEGPSLSLMATLTTPFVGEFGAKVVALPDQAGDFCDDLAISAPGADGFVFTQAGVVAYYDACITGTSTPSVYIQGGSDNQRLGDSLADAGDPDGSGTNDLVAGSPYDGADGSAWILLDPVNLSGLWPCDTVGVELIAADAGGRTGAAVAGIGHFDGDTYDDLAIGVPFSTQPTGSHAGGVRIVRGGPTLTAGTSVSLGSGYLRYGAAGYDYIGWSLTGLGDVLGSAQDDVAVGAPYAGSQGAVFLLTGAAVPVTSAAVQLSTRIYGVGPAGLVGWDVEHGTDIDGDKKDELVVGGWYSKAAAPFAAHFD